jgi:glycosyltransferase involved in cell wall biosynthesis
MMKVLWLASWFPGRTDATNGDFVERQAIALGRKVSLSVISVTKDERIKPGTFETEVTTRDGIRIYQGYYGRNRWHRLLEPLLSWRKHLVLQKKLYRMFIEAEGKPDIVHVHVAMKAGQLARWLKRKEGIIYWLTEHWTGYYPQSQPSLYSQHWLIRRMTCSIIKNTIRLLPVSEDLGKTICENVVRVPFTVIPNVVDTKLFYPVGSPAGAFRFIHASYLNFQKNPEGILAAATLLAKRGYRFELLLVGREDEALAKQARLVTEAGAVVRFLPAVPHREVAPLMQSAHAMLLFSHFENLPCVILEALCCGLPVISSKVGGIAEVIDQSNGILVTPGEVDQLANAMQQMIDNYNIYNREAIAGKAAARFSDETVTQQLLDCYATPLS